jgi:methionyl-tRNA formyltransferase
MRIVLFGSGAFGLPTLKRLAQEREHEVVLVVTQPDRPAGRSRALTSTPIAAFAEARGIETFKPEDPNAAESVSHVHAARADAYVVIAYGHKLSDFLIGDTFALNLHSSLLPKFRGAAPINRAMMANERETGVSVITLDQRMDAGAILAQRATRIDPFETAGELHDRLAEIGAEAVAEVLVAFAAGTLCARPQDESHATRAPKLTKAEGTVAFDQPADSVRARVHGLNPWPGCTVRLDGREVKLVRVQVVSDAATEGDPGTLLEDGTIACAPGLLRVLAMQPAGGKVMSFDAFRRGHSISSWKVEPL